MLSPASSSPQGTNTVIPPEARVALPEDERAYPVVYLLNLETVEGRSALTELENMAEAAGRDIHASAMKFALNYSNSDPVTFVAARVD